MACSTVCEVYHKLIRMFILYQFPLLSCEQFSNVFKTLTSHQTYGVTQKKKRLDVQTFLENI